MPSLRSAPIVLFVGKFSSMNIKLGVENCPILVYYRGKIKSLSTHIYPMTET